ncbi:MAG TPA: hypothetical protein VJL28_02275 [Gemmatimonadaceae bacterium]|nr:hypothetical protein [Gemmatimonadaceae bacterium]
MRAGCVALALLVPGVLAAQAGGAFPHARHASLFTSCLECHAGIPAGDSARAFPAASDCLVCHDGAAEKRVDWTPKAARGGGVLVFSHPAHAKRAGKEATCETCHAAGPGAMNVARATPEKCLSCHAHQATAHKAQGNNCATCHRSGRVRVHQAGFARSHGAAAATEALTCAGCHARRFCADCHAGERNARRYHPANFASRHAPEAYSRDVACSGCHSTEAFCRDCHRQTGLAAKTGSRSTRYHNAQPRWLLQHGRAARQELSTCASCHQQSYCMACHSDAGWRVSPHGPTFDAARMHRRNPTLCVRCHLKDPLAGK